MTTNKQARAPEKAQGTKQLNESYWLLLKVVSSGKSNRSDGPFPIHNDNTVSDDNMEVLKVILPIHDLK